MRTSCIRKVVRFLSKQGQLQPRFHSKARSISTQLENRLLQRLSFRVKFASFGLKQEWTSWLHDKLQQNSVDQKRIAAMLSHDLHIEFFIGKKDEETTRKRVNTTSVSEHLWSFDSGKIHSNIRNVNKRVFNSELLLILQKFRQRSETVKTRLFVFKLPFNHVILSEHVTKGDWRPLVDHILDRSPF